MSISNINIDLGGFDIFQNQLKALEKDMAFKVIQSTVYELGNRVMADFIKVTPVDTGQLEGAWFMTKVVAEKGGYTVTIENNTEYASALFLGHELKNGGYYGGFAGGHLLQDIVLFWDGKVAEVFEQKLREVLGL